MHHCFFLYIFLLNNVKSNYFGSQEWESTGKTILVQFVVYFLKGQEPFQCLQMKQEIKHVSSEAHLASAEHKPDPPQKLCSRCYVFMLNLQSLVPQQGWGLRQGLGKTQLKSSGNKWASCLSRHRIRLRKSPVSIGPSVTHVTTSVTGLLCVTGALGSSWGPFSLGPWRPPPRIVLFPWKKNYWGTQSA